VRSHRLAVCRLKRLIVGPLVQTCYGRSFGQTDVGPRQSAILAEGEGGRSLVIAAGYPYSWLLAVAHDLAHRCSVAAPESTARSDAATIPLVESAVEATGFCERDEQPANSNVVLQPQADGVRIVVPALGMWRGGGCFVLFSLIWFGAAAAVLLASLGASRSEANQGGLWFVVGECLLVGFAVLSAAIVLGCRRAELVVAGDTLRARRTGVFGTRERSWHRDEIEDIRTGPSGSTVNDEDVLELQIHPRKGRVFGLLGWRNGDELAWLVTVLRRALQVPGSCPTPMQAGEWGQTWGATGATSPTSPKTEAVSEGQKVTKSLSGTSLARNTNSRRG
jgi:hypothetical protein